MQNLVQWVSSTGEVIFDPSGLVQQIWRGAGKSIIAGAALFVISLGVRLVFDFLKASGPIPEGQVRVHDLSTMTRNVNTARGQAAQVRQKMRENSAHEREMRGRARARRR